MENNTIKPSRKVIEVKYGDGYYARRPISDSSVKEATSNVKKHVKYEKMEFNRKISDIIYSPKNIFYEVEYGPEFDTSDECTEYQVNFFHSRSIYNRHSIISIITISLVRKSKNWSPHPSIACFEVPRKSQPKLSGL